MKNKILIAIAAIFLLGTTSCAYKTCPTYSKTTKASPSKIAKV